jgi:Na+-driven multidrug efflux pump
LELLFASLNNLRSTNVLSLGRGVDITLNIVFIVMLALHGCCLAGLTEQAAKRKQKNYQSVKKLWLLYCAGGLLIGRTVAVLVTMTLATSMAAREGPIPMAGHQICVQVWLTVSLLTDALALAGQVYPAYLHINVLRM